MGFRWTSAFRWVLNIIFATLFFTGVDFTGVHFNCVNAISVFEPPNVGRAHGTVDAMEKRDAMEKGGDVDDTPLESEDAQIILLLLALSWWAILISGGGNSILSAIYCGAVPRRQCRC